MGAVPRCCLSLGAHRLLSCCSWFSFWKKVLPNSYVLIIMAQAGATLTTRGRKPEGGRKSRINLFLF